MKIAYLILAILLISSVSAENYSVSNVRSSGSSSCAPDTPEKSDYEQQKEDLAKQKEYLESINASITAYMKNQTEKIEKIELKPIEQSIFQKILNFFRGLFK